MNRKLLAALLILPLLSAAAANPPPPAWPEVTRAETRPWTWWWWHGCAAETNSINTMLDQFHDVGLGGVAIVCVNDVNDPTKPKVKYLSKEYVDLLRFSVKKARSLGMDADISPCGGWALGAKFIPLERSCARVAVRRIKLDAAFDKDGRNVLRGLGALYTFANIESMLAVSADGLTRRVLPKKALDPDGTFPSALAQTYAGGMLFVTFVVPGSSYVRASTPDWHGYVVDHLKKDDVDFYFAAFDRAFAGVPENELPRAYNNDSWEISLDWTRGFMDEFLKRRGYDLREYIPEFLGRVDPRFLGTNGVDTVRRVVCDYRETLSDLMIDGFMPAYTGFAARHGGKTIGEVQFEPGNELDLNALYDIPQADMGGGLGWYLRRGDIYLDQIFMRAKMPGSPAHILGKPYISSETYTCMGGLATPLSFAKEKTDIDFIAGINHTMYHGITYTPNSSHWPGWLFYAGTQLGPFNPQWRNMDALSAYITRSQSFLQQGRSANDILFYFAMHDEWSLAQPGGDNPPGPVDLSACRFASADMPTAHWFWLAGVDFDYVTDRLLASSVSVKDGKFVTPGNEYKAIAVGNCDYMPETTLERIVGYAKDGGTVIFVGPLPRTVPGFGNLAKRMTVFNGCLREIGAARGTVKEGAVPFGKGRFVFGTDVKKCCVAAGIARETMSDQGLRFVRRRDAKGWTYFILNRPRNGAIDAWVPFAVGGKSAALYDPLTGMTGKAAFRAKDGGSEVYLQLPVKGTVIVRILDDDVTAKAWDYFKPAAGVAAVPVAGPWHVTFVAGGETLPHPETVTNLTPWTAWTFTDQTNALTAFAGTGRYETTFDAPAGAADEWELDLGTVDYSAEVTLNGRNLGKLIAGPMVFRTGTLLPKGNKLVVEVTNTPYNRAMDLTRRHVNWIYNVSGYGFENGVRSLTPHPSGLVGPVRLMPLMRRDPGARDVSAR